MTVLERLKKLEKEKEKLLADAKKEGLDKANAAIAELNALGFTYALVEDGKGRKKTQVRQIDPNKPCAICKFATEPNHDSRKHRGQETKKAFTAKELEELGLKKKP